MWRKGVLVRVSYFLSLFLTTSVVRSGTVETKPTDSTFNCNSLLHEAEVCFLFLLSPTVRDTFRRCSSSRQTSRGATGEPWKRRWRRRWRSPAAPTTARFSAAFRSNEPHALFLKMLDRTVSCIIASVWRVRRSIVCRPTVNQWTRCCRRCVMNVWYSIHVVVG